LLEAAFKSSPVLSSSAFLHPPGPRETGPDAKAVREPAGMGEATVSRWETGAQIQQRAMDRFLRVCLASPAAVELLRSDFQTSAAGVAN